MSDAIERSILIAAPVERVWELVSRAEHLGAWFADAGAEVDLRPGGRLSLTWREHGTVKGRVEAVDPPRHVSYRWLTRHEIDEEPTPANSTLIDLRLAAEGDGTRVTVVESGFDGLEMEPEERITIIDDHTEGWRVELGHLAEHADR